MCARVYKPSPGGMIAANFRQTPTSDVPACPHPQVALSGSLAPSYNTAGSSKPRRSRAPRPPQPQRLPDRAHQARADERRRPGALCGQTFGTPIMDLAPSTSHLPVDAIDRKLMIKHQVLALGRRGNRLTLAWPTRPTCASSTRSASRPGSPSTGGGRGAQAGRPRRAISETASRPSRS